MLLYKNIPLTLYSRKSCKKGCESVDVGYVWKVSWRWRETATYWPQVPLTIAALLPHSAGLLIRSHWGTNSSVWSWFSLRGHPISNCDWNSNSNWLELCLVLQLTATQTELELTQAVCGTWLYNYLTPTCFLFLFSLTYFIAYQLRKNFSLQTFSSWY